MSKGSSVVIIEHQWIWTWQLSYEGIAPFYCASALEVGPILLNHIVFVHGPFHERINGAWLSFQNPSQQIGIPR
jgi:hypothetical protein